MKHNLFSLGLNTLTRHRKWPATWTQATPAEKYEVIIVGGGGHGLATAYYLAKNHGITNVAVMEKGWIGGGNTGRNTTIIRSNYLYDPSIRFYDFSLKTYEGLSRELDYNLMFGQHGVINLAYSRHEMHLMNRRVNALRHQGVDAEIVDVARIQKLLPQLNTSPDASRPIFGGFLQPRGGTCRHDAVVWGYARAASALGIDIVQNCAVEDVVIERGVVKGVKTSQGLIKSGKVVLTVAGGTTALAASAGVRLPITCLTLQAMVSEPIKPIMNVVLDGAIYISQSDHGELVVGGGTDLYNTFAQRGMASVVEANFAGILEMFPGFSRLKWMRQWAGTVDYTPDHSPIIGKLPMKGLYMSGGWGSYGFKAIPAGGLTLAHTVARNKPHPLIEPFGLERFETGALIDEGASSGMDMEQAIL